MTCCSAHLRYYATECRNLNLYDQVSTNKFLIECDPEDTELDLIGDAGAVGRLLEGVDGEREGSKKAVPFKLDLKGVV